MKLSKQERRDMICMFVNAANILADRYDPNGNVDGCCSAMEYAMYDLQSNDDTDLEYWDGINANCCRMMRQIFEPKSVYWWGLYDVESRLFALLTCAALLMNEMEPV